MNCPNCKAVGTLRVIRAAALGFPVYVGCEAPGCFWNQEPLAELVIEAAVASWHRANTLPRSCPDCGAGIVIGQKIAVCEANKYASRSGAGDCRWELALTPDLRRQADEALAAQVAA